MKPGRRVVPESLSTPGGAPTTNGGTNAPAEGPPATAPAPPSPDKSSEAPQPAQEPQQPQEPQTAAVCTSRAAFRAPAAQQAPVLSAAEQLRRLEQQQVSDVAAELERLHISYSSTAQDGLFAGIQLDLKPATLKLLKKLQAPTIDELKAIEGDDDYPTGLHGVLQGASKCARLSRQPLLGRPSLLVRATCAVKAGWACGCLAGRLTEAPDEADLELKPHQAIITAEEINECGKRWGSPKYKGPDLLLDMTQSANEFTFLPDTVLRPEEGNVALSMCLVRDAKQGLVLPLITVVADRDLMKGEELVALSCRDTATRACEAAEAARKAAEEAEEALQQLKAAGSPAKVAKAEDAAAADDEAAEDAELAAEDAEEEETAQLPGKAIEQLLPSGWRQHTLDIFFRRHAELAAKLAGSKAGGSKPQQLKAALAAAVERYYGSSNGDGKEGEDAGETQETGSQSGSKTKDGGNSGDKSDSGSDSGESDGSDAEAAALRQLQAALEASLLAHPPPLSTQQLSKQLTLETGKRFVPFGGFERPLQQSSDFSSLKPETAKLLDQLEDEPEKLPAGCADQLESGGCFSGIQVCEVAARLHRVRLLTPPNCRALSMHAPPKGKQLQPGGCACIYVGQAFESSEVANPDSAYLFDIAAHEVAAASGAEYSGPSLLVDAASHRNEAAFANCVFSSDLDSNLKPKVVWDPQGKRPHMALVFIGQDASQPGEELLLDYGFHTYWKVQVAKARQAHEEYAELAGEVILTLREALKEAGASDKELGDCLLPVDLAQDHQQYSRVAAA